MPTLDNKIMLCQLATASFYTNLGSLQGILVSNLADEPNIGLKGQERASGIGSLVLNLALLH